MRKKSKDPGRLFVDEGGVVHWVSPYATMSDEEIKAAKAYAFTPREIKPEEPTVQDKKRLTVSEMNEILEAQRAEAEAQRLAEQEAIRRDFPAWLLEFADQLRIPKQYNDLLAFKEWVVYVLEYGQTKRGGALSVNRTFDDLGNSEFAPFLNVSSHIFFVRLFRHLEQQGFLTAGCSNQPRHLVEGAIKRLK